MLIETVVIIEYRESINETFRSNLDLDGAQASFFVSFCCIQTLESDMLIAQSMVASRYTHFKKESLEWQRSLSFVSDVMTMLNGIQVSKSAEELSWIVAQL